MFQQKLFCHLEEKRAANEGKLIFYAKVKNRFGQEGYLSAQNVKHRNAIRDMRMSTRKLSIGLTPQIG